MTKLVEALYNGADCCRNLSLYFRAIEVIIKVDIKVNIKFNNEVKINMKNEINFPEWMNKDTVISALREKEGSDLYNFFGFKDSTSTTKFLNRFLPEKPKNIRWSTHIKSLLEIEVKNDVNIEVKNDVKPKSIRQQMIEIYEKTKGSIFIDKYMTEEITKEDYYAFRKEWAQILAESAGMK